MAIIPGINSKSISIDKETGILCKVAGCGFGPEPRTLIMENKPPLHSGSSRPAILRDFRSVLRTYLSSRRWDSWGLRNLLLVSSCSLLVPSPPISLVSAQRKRGGLRFAIASQVEKQTS